MTRAEREPELKIRYHAPHATFRKHSEGGLLVNGFHARKSVPLVQYELNADDKWNG